MVSLLHTKHFSVDEAQKVLSSIIPQVEEIVRLKKILDAKGYDIYRHQYFGGMGPNGDNIFPKELEKLVEIVKYLDKNGILIKSFDAGLIDFPHIRSNNEEVYLCWKLGEENIKYWHTLSAGFAGRRPLSEL